MLAQAAANLQTNLHNGKTVLQVPIKNIKMSEAFESFRSARRYQMQSNSKEALPEFQTLDPDSLRAATIMAKQSSTEQASAISRSPQKLPSIKLQETSVQVQMQQKRAALLEQLQPNDAFSHRLTTIQAVPFQDPLLLADSGEKSRKVHYRSNRKQLKTTIATNPRVPQMKFQMAAQQCKFSDSRQSLPPATVAQTLTQPQKTPLIGNRTEIKVRELRPFTATNHQKSLARTSGAPSLSSQQDLLSKEQTKGDSQMKGKPTRAAKIEGLSHHHKQQSCPENMACNMAEVDTNNLQQITTKEIEQSDSKLQQITQQSQNNSTQKPPRPTTDHFMIINQQYQDQFQQALQHRQNNVNQNSSSGIRENGHIPGAYLKAPVTRKSTNDQDYFILDNQNRVILVNTGVPSANNTLVQPSVNICLRSGARSGGRDKNSVARQQILTQAQTSIVPSQNQQPAQGKVFEQINSKGSVKRKAGSKVNKASLKENQEVQRLEQQTKNLASQSKKDASTRNESVGSGNRNSNQNMKTAANNPSDVSARISFNRSTTFSGTTSTYHSIVAGTTVIQDPQTGVIYQLDQNNLNYLLAQMPTQAQKHARQLAIHPPQTNQVPLSQYFSNPQMLNPLQQQAIQIQLQQQLQLQQKQGQGSSSRPRPKSSAPNPNIKAKQKHQNASRDMPRGLKVQESREEMTVRQSRQILQENLMQKTGHIIVTSVAGTPLNGPDLATPMIINQKITAQTNNYGQNMMNRDQALPVVMTFPSAPQTVLGSSGKQTKPREMASLCVTGLVHPDVAMIQQQRDSLGTNSSQPPTKHRDALASTQNGFFGKRNNRDSKLGMHNSSQKGSNQHNLGVNVPVTTNPQQLIATKDNFSSGSARPLTSKQSFHKTTASLNFNGLTPSQALIRALASESDFEQINHESGSLRIKKNSVQGNSQLITDACMTQLQGGQNSMIHQKNLSSVRSGNLNNHTNSITSNAEAHNDLTIFKQQSTQEKQKLLNQSASPSTKISIKGRKGIGSIIGNPGGVTGAGANTGLQMLPSTPKTYKRTKRVLFARRMNLMDRPLLIITFQGVLGDFMRKQVVGLKETQIAPSMAAQLSISKQKKVAEKEEDSVNLRGGVIEGLKQLSQMFQLIIFSRETIEESWFDKQGGQNPVPSVQTKAILNFLTQNSDIKLDGLYASLANSQQQTMTDDYSQIFVDFGLNSEQKVKERVLFISSIANDFICNQRLPISGNISPKGKKPNPIQLGISNARGLTDIDPYGYFMFDISCQPPQPLVNGIPISIENKSSKYIKVGTRSSSIIVDGEDQILCPFGKEKETTVTTRCMPTTLLVPNLRTQNVKSQTNFMHVVKSVMMLAFLSQKKTQTLNMLKDPSIKDLTTELADMENEFAAIKEKQIRFTHKKLQIMPHMNREWSEIDPQMNEQQKQPGAQRRYQQQSGVLKEIESPGSDTSGRNGSQGKICFNGRIQGTISSRTAATTKSGNENTGSSSNSANQRNQLRSTSINSDKWPQGELEQANQQLLQNDSYSNVIHSEHSPKENHTVAKPKEISIDLTDGTFFGNLSWSKGVDYLSSKPMAFQKKFLGMQAAQSDVVWRFYKKQAYERLKLRQIYEKRMQASDQLVNQTLSNETIVANQQKNMEEIFAILRSRDLVGNPFGFTMGRNYRFFANLKQQLRRKLSLELDQWNARNEAVVAASQANATTNTADDKDLNVNLQALQQQHQEVLEELLEKNQLVSRFVVVGLDAPFQK